MKIVSWNVNGLRSLTKNNSWKTFLEETRPDIFCLQETKASPEQLPEDLRDVRDFSSFFSSSQVKKGYSGVALYSKIEPLSVRYGMGIRDFDCEGRLVGVEFEDFWLLNVYFPNGGRGPERLDYKLRFYDAFLVFVERLRKNKPIIFCGDVNTAHEEVDLARPHENERSTGFLPEERAWIDEVVSAGYVDAYRRLHPNRSGAYTYWDMRTRARDRNLGWRIDYFFVANELMTRVRDATIHANIFGSDHCPLSLVMR